MNVKIPVANMCMKLSGSIYKDIMADISWEKSAYFLILADTDAFSLAKARKWL